MKTTPFLLTSVLLLCMASTFAQYGGTTGALTWNFNLSSGILTIKGEGEMPDYANYGSHFPPWFMARDYIKTVIIEDDVTSIGNTAFYYCAKITSIAIPNSVTSIGHEAFYSCSGLYAITIPNNVTRIGDMAFYECSSLNMIMIPAGVANIGNRAFSFCYSLISIDVDSKNNSFTSVNGVLYDKNKTKLICCPIGKTGSYVIPDNVEHIEDYAFHHCENLTSVFLPKSITSIGVEAFYHCIRMISIAIPNGIVSIGEKAFTHCTSLTSIILPDKITKIGNKTFLNCVSLTSIMIPNSVSRIGELAFYSCINLTSLSIPTSVTYIGDGAFASCYKLSLITNLNPVPVPPQGPIGTFTGVDYDSCKLIVPSSSVQAYENAALWFRFNIEGGGILVNPVANNIEYGYAIGNGLYEMDTTATVTAIANENCKFINWTKDDVEISRDNSYSFTVTEDIKLVANFESDGTGIKTNEIAADVKVYPNPTTGELRVTSIEYQVSSIEVFDVYGRKTISDIRYPKSDIVINISYLQTGIYFVKIITEKGIVTKKIVKL